MTKKIIFILFMFMFLIKPLLSINIFDSAKKGDLKSIIKLVKENADIINKKNKKSLNTAIHYAARFGQLEVIKYLYKMGAKLTIKNVSGEMPIHYAAGEGFTNIAGFLLDQGVNIDVITKYNHTPLSYAVFFNRKKMVEFLIRRGCKLSMKDKNEETALDTAIESRKTEIAEILRKNGAKQTPISDPKIIKVSGNIYRIAFIDAGNPNVAVSSGEEGVMLIDTGYYRMINQLKNAVKKIKSEKIKFIINTHLHPDHIGGNSIGEEKSRIINWKTLQKAVSDGLITINHKILSGKIKKHFKKSYLFEFNGEKILIVPSPGVHTKEDLLLYFTKSKVLNMGDLLISESFPSVYVESEKYLNLLDEVAVVFPEDTIFQGGHGKELSKKELIEYKNMLKSISDITSVL